MNYRIIVLALMLFCPSVTGWAKEHFPFTGEVSTDKVSVRAGQNVNFERVDILKEGTKVIVHDEQYGWYKIQLPSTAKVYIRLDYVAVENDETGRISGNRVNVRAGRGVNFSPLGQLEKDQYIHIVSKIDDWFQIAPVEGMYGWVSKDYVTFKSETLPSLASLGLAPVVAPSSALAAVAAATGTSPEEGELKVSSTSVSVSGLIEAISAPVMLSNTSYQLKTDDGKIYYLKIQPELIGSFSNEYVHIEGNPVANVASLSNPVVAVKKFQLIL